MLFRNLQDAIYLVPALFIALSFHEFAHGKVADLLGDPTPRSHGRLTLNPIKHIDPIGLLMLMIVGFGWAKPVPVNPLYFRGDRRRGMLLVAMAGPGTNFVLAMLAGIGRTVALNMAIRGIGMSIPIHAFLFFEYLLMFNVFLGIFNLLPVPPLDGSKILFNILPSRYTHFMFQIERYGFMILLLILLTGAHRFFLLPAASAITGLITSLAVLLITPFF
jgi:Zn-dependent protease